MKTTAHRNRRVRHTVALGVTLAVALVGAATGCGESAEEGPVKSLSVLDYYTDEPANTQIDKMFQECGDQAGVTIKRQSVPGPQLMPKVLQRASSRTLPDVLMLNNPDVQQVAETGALTPLDELGLSTEGYANAVTDAVTYKGKQYGLGSTSNTLALFYNKKMFAEAGLKPPRSWSELRRTAKKLTDGSRYGLAFAAPSDYEAAWQFLPFLWSNQGDETALTSDRATEALQLWADLVDSGSASRSVVNWRQADVKDQFTAGKAAMMVNGPWQIPELNQSKIDWGVVQVPPPSSSGQAVAPLGGEVWTVPRSESAQRSDKASEVVRCITNDRNSLKRANDAFQVPSKLSVAKKYAAKTPSMKPFVDQITDARALTGKLGTKYPKRAEAIYQAIQAALTGRSSVGEALREAQSGE